MTLLLCDILPFAIGKVKRLLLPRARAIHDRGLRDSSAMLTLNVPGAFACEPPGPGTGTPGYWKNHPEAWPVEVITIGGVTYTKEAAIAIMDTPGKGDKTYTLFNALVAANLKLDAYNNGLLCAPPRD